MDRVRPRPEFYYFFVCWEDGTRFVARPDVASVEGMEGMGKLLDWARERMPRALVRGQRTSKNNNDDRKWGSSLHALAHARSG